MLRSIHFKIHIVYLVLDVLEITGKEISNEHGSSQHAYYALNIIRNIIALIEYIIEH